jgi:hypothetical protein
MKYDSTWKYLGAKKLLRQAHWPQGVATDGKRFFVAYVNTSQRGLTTFFPVSTNVHLAAFDLNWHLLEDVALTDFTPTDYMQPGRPWVICHGNRLYVSFDVDQVDPQSLEEMLAWQAVVNIYEIGAGPTAVSQVKEIPGRCRLEQNYPNPFNPTTGIRFQIPGVSEVRLSVYDLLGREVAVLVNGRMGAGAHEVTFDGSALPSGVYFYRLQVRGSDSASPRDSKIGEGRSVETKKLLLVR